jgi:hypothetical protein
VASGVGRVTAVKRAPTLGVACDADGLAASSPLGCSLGSQAMPPQHAQHRAAGNKQQHQQRPCAAMVTVAARGMLETIVSVVPGMQPVHGGGVAPSELIATLLSCPALNYVEKLHLHAVIGRAKTALQRPGHDPEGDLQGVTGCQRIMVAEARSVRARTRQHVEPAQPGVQS